MIAVGVLGYGYWGPNLARVFDASPHARVVAVADPSSGRLAEAAARHPGVRVTTRPDDLIADPALDAIVIATPIVTHAELADAALRAGKHVLVEKPLALHSGDAVRLVDTAAHMGRVLMVDHTFVYTGAIREVRRLVRTGVIGDVICWEATRTSLGRFQPDAGVLWDLAVHDLAILDFVLGTNVTSIAVDGLAIGSASRPDAATLMMRVGTSCLAHVHVNWVAARKVRRTTIVGTRGTIEYDEAEPADKVKVFERETEFHDPAAIVSLRVAHRAGRMWTPSLDTCEPLRTMADHFLTCIETGRTPDTDGASGHRVVRWLEAAELFLAQRRDGAQELQPLRSRRPCFEVAGAPSGPSSPS